MKNLDRIKGCLIGGAVGDALGYPIEFMSIEEIRQQYGTNGLTDYILTNNIAQISDDTQMTLFTITGLLYARQNFINRWPEWTNTKILLQSIFHNYQDWFLTQTCEYPLPPNIITYSKLVNIPEMFSMRAPGSTCLNALHNGKIGTMEHPLNDSKGCGGLMRVAPIALALYDTRLSNQEIAFLGAQVAAITHGHSLGYIPAAALIFILLDLLQGKSISQAVDNLSLSLFSIFLMSEDLVQLLTYIKFAQKMAQEKVSNEHFFKLLGGGGWVAEETLAIAIFSALKYHDNFEKGILAAVNHSGDSDSTGSVTGQILGTALGLQNIPEKYIQHLELKNTILELANDLQRFNITNKYDWKTIDMPRQNDTFILERTFTLNQMNILRKGNKPKSMDDKWFFYMESNTLYAHRSWTGYCIYKINFSQDNQHKVIVNRDPKQYKRTNINEDREILNKLLDCWLGM